jgi:hypothetical protein
MRRKSGGHDIPVPLSIASVSSCCAGRVIVYVSGVWWVYGCFLGKI